MRTRRMGAQEAALIKKHANVVGDAARHTRSGIRVFTAHQVAAAFEAERKEQQAKLQASMQEDSDYFTSPEFRQEVIDELIAAGATLEQATNRTRDQSRLFCEAKALKMM